MSVASAMSAAAAVSLERRLCLVALEKSASAVVSLGSESLTKLM